MLEMLTLTLTLVVLLLLMLMLMLMLVLAGTEWEPYWMRLLVELRMP